MNEGPILVTGAAGFIGARVVETLSAGGHSLICVDKLSHFSDRPEHQHLNFQSKIDREHLFPWLREHRPKLQGMIHLGACTDTTELDLAKLNHLNLDYSKQLWTYATKERIPFVYASSAATYGDGREGYADNEADIEGLRPLNPYGDSKQQFDLWALKKERKDQTPPQWSGFKFFNVFGFGERHKGKMASVVLHASDQLRSEGRVKLFRSHREGIADGLQKRDFIYVEDVVEVLLFALKRPIRRGIYNLGTGTARSFLDLVRAVFHEHGKAPSIEFIDMPEVLRDRYQYFTEAEMKRLREQGYDKPFHSLEEGVAKYVRRLSREV